MTGAPDTLRVLVVDDEPIARASLRLAMAAMSGVEVIGEAASGDEAVERIATLEPDAVFLDIQMPAGDGFSVIERVGPDHMPTVVFVTAYDEFAVRAFEVHALDYILKPFEDVRLATTVDRLRRQRGRILGADLSARLRAFLDARDAGSGPPRYAVRIMTFQGDRIRFVATTEVDWFEAARNYVRLHVGPATHLVRTPLTALLEQLDPRRFVRVHRSIVVNVDRIREVQPWFGGDYLAILRDGQQLKVSRTYRENLLRQTS